MPVSVRIDPTAFDPGGLLDGTPIEKARYILQSGVESSPHIAHGAWFSGRDGYQQPPNSISIVCHGTSPSWFGSVEAFNNLPLAEIRLQLANEVDRGLLEVLNSAGTPVTGDAIRAGTVT